MLFLFFFLVFAVCVVVIFYIQLRRQRFSLVQPVGSENQNETTRQYGVNSIPIA